MKREKEIGELYTIHMPAGIKLTRQNILYFDLISCKYTPIKSDEILLYLGVLTEDILQHFLNSQCGTKFTNSLKKMYRNRLRNKDGEVFYVTGDNVAAKVIVLHENDFRSDKVRIVPAEASYEQ